MIYERADCSLAEGYPHKFGPADFDQLLQLLDGCQVVPLAELVEASPPDPRQLVGLRHDVDHNLEHALKFARWENAHGLRSSYYLLHTAWYWRPRTRWFDDALCELVDLGHEVGIHNNAVAAARDKGEDPGHAFAAEILEQALWQLRTSTPADVIGVAAHGDARCAKYRVHNNDLWLEQGGTRRLTDYGLRYEAYFLHAGMHYLSDNHGLWNAPLEHNPPQTTMMLVHPCHWDIDAAP